MTQEQDIFRSRFEKVCVSGYQTSMEQMLQDPLMDNLILSSGLLAANRHNRIKIVRKILSHPLLNQNSLNLGGRPWNLSALLGVAAINNYFNLVKLYLRDPRIDPTWEENRALVWASQHKKTETVEILLADKRVLRGVITPIVAKNYPELLNSTVKDILVEEPILAKNFRGLVDPEILKPYEHLLGEFDMF